MDQTPFLIAVAQLTLLGLIFLTLIGFGAWSVFHVGSFGKEMTKEMTTHGQHLSAISETLTKHDDTLGEISKAVNKVQSDTAQLQTFQYELHARVADVIEMKACDPDNSYRKPHATPQWERTQIASKRLQEFVSKEASAESSKGKATNKPGHSENPSQTEATTAKAPAPGPKDASTEPSGLQDPFEPQPAGQSTTGGGGSMYGSPEFRRRLRAGQNFAFNRDTKADLKE